jgi:hypothetical protein
MKLLMGLRKIVIFSTVKDSKSGVTSFICREDPYPSQPPNPAEPISWAPASTCHPRLLTTPKELDHLRSRLGNPIESKMLQHLVDHFEDSVKKCVIPVKGADLNDRSYSSLLGPTALLYRLTNEEKYLKAAKKHTLALVRCAPKLIKPKGDLPCSHALTALAWSYDFLHETWTNQEREEIVRFVTKLGTSFFSVTAAPLAYWSSVILQNHSQVAWTALAHAGMAFYQEIPEAREWAQWSHRIYRTIAWLQPPDGSNMEGPSYGGYGNERRVMHYEAARRCLGENLYGAGEKQARHWYQHLMLPDAKPDRNAFPWGDNPIHIDNHGATHTLLAYARAFRDPRAQGLALDLWRRGVRSDPFLNLLMYDPSVSEASHSEEPLARHFEDLDLICARSSWKDKKATAVSFMCGPYQGHRVMSRADGDLGGAHCHADSNSLQYYSRGEFLLRDPGYEWLKHTDYHNTVLVDGLGQMGEGIKWFNVHRIHHYRGWAEVRSFHQDEHVTSWVGDASKIYIPEAGLKRFHRHVAYIRPDLLIVLDDLEASKPRIFSQLWHAESSFRALDKKKNGWGFKQGKASLSVWPLAFSKRSLDVETRAQDLSDLKISGLSQHELRINSPASKKWIFITVIASGDSAKGPPLLKAEVSMPQVTIIQESSSPFSIRFDIEYQKAPEILPRIKTHNYRL